MFFEIEIASPEECRKLYHGTSLKNATSIIENGFKISKSAERKIFFTNTLPYAKTYANWTTLMNTSSTPKIYQYQYVLLQVNLESYEVYKIKNDYLNKYLKNLLSKLGGYNLPDEDIYEYFVNYDLPASCIKKIIRENVNDYLNRSDC